MTRPRARLRDYALILAGCAGVVTGLVVVGVAWVRWG